MLFEQINPIVQHMLEAEEMNFSTLKRADFLNPLHAFL